MLKKIDIAKVLFLDIECVSDQKGYHDLNEDFRDLWQIKAKQILRKYEEGVTEEEAADLYPRRAAIYAEFGKIVCISVGFVGRDKVTKQLTLRIKSFADHDESKILKDFSELINQHFNLPGKNFFCGHNIKEFDIPYICRRMVVHQLPLPGMLDIAGKKPWETKHLLDTLELWKFGDRKAYTSLKLLAATLGFPSPKEDMDGSEVGTAYWEEKDLDKIAVYCEKDVLATVQLFLRYKQMPLFEDDQVVFVGR